MTRLLLCLLALAACGLPDKHHCADDGDCLGGDVCRAGTCQPTTNAACGPMHTACAPEATCVDAPAGLACTCQSGYAGDGASCADIDECVATPSSCPAHAACSNTPGAFSCACDAGFTGDGSYCVPSRFAKIAVAGGYSCGLADTGGIYCWGDNASGNLGDGTLQSHARPVQVGTANDWTDVDARFSTACGLRSDHSMWCWGLGDRGQLGDGRIASASTPTKVISDGPVAGWKAMAVGISQVCGLHDDGSLACWGNYLGTVVGQPVAVDLNTDWTHIAAGSVLCGIRGAPGHLYCWGMSSDDTLGLGSVTAQATPAQVGTDTWSTVGVGRYNACGIRSDGALLCWGTNRLNLTSLQYGDTPRQIGTATDWQAVRLYIDTVNGLRAGGHAYAWGANDRGQLGLPWAFEVDEPTEMPGPVTGWSQVSSGSLHGCGVAAGQAYCWGTVADGLLGDGAVTTQYRPTRLGDDRWTALAGGPGTCGIRSDGALMCWGADPRLGIGLGNTDPAWAPTRIGTDRWTAVAGSASVFDGAATCGLRGGVPSCWGDNSTGELGIGSQTGPQLTPVPAHVPEATQWTEIAISDHTCAIASDATLWCWGSNDVGQLGTGTRSNPTLAPLAPLPGTWLHVAVTPTSTVVTPDVFSMTCGIRTDHTLWCWGQDRYPSPTEDLVPTRVGTGAAWASLSIGKLLDHPRTCAIQLDGTLWCWGALPGGDATTPVQIGTDRDWQTVAIGGEFCAVKKTGTLWCWANQGILGDGTRAIVNNTSPTLAPVRIGSDTDWATVVTNADHDQKSCALKVDGTLWCWGLRASPVPDLVTTPVPVR